MFEESIENYKKLSDQQPKDDIKMMYLNSEVSKRLHQINWIISKIKFLEIQFFKKQESGEFEWSLFYEIEILTEAFYHLAFRIRDIIRKNHPQLHSFETVGVRDVRNHLLVHPEGRKEEAKLFSTFSLTGEPNIGPRIKSYLGPEGSTTDNGLYPNSKEFNDNLNALIIKVL